MTRSVKQKRGAPTTARRKVAISPDEKLMMAALDLFANRGFSAVSIKELARAAKVNSALIYYYYENKEGLFKATVEHAISQALENYARLKKRHTSPIDLINDWFLNNLELSASIRKLVKIMLDYANSLTRLPSVEVLIRRFYAEEASILINSIREGSTLGLFKPVDAERVASFVSVHLDGIMVASMIRPRFDVQNAISDLQKFLGEYLGYDDDWGRSESKRALQKVR